jgi:hypothetical protein
MIFFDRQIRAFFIFYANNIAPGFLAVAFTFHTDYEKTDTQPPQKFMHWMGRARWPVGYRAPRATLPKGFQLQPKRRHFLRHDPQ